MMQLSAKNLRRVLIGSLIANVFLASYVATAWIAVSAGVSPHFATILPGAAPKAKRKRFDPRAALAALDQPHRQKADRILQKKRKELSEGWQQRREQRRHVRKLLTAEKLDSAELKTTLTALRRRGDENREVFSNLLLELADALPDEQRRRYFQHGIPRFWRSSRKKRR